MSGQPLFPEKAKTPEKKRLKRRLQSIRFKIFASFFSIFTIFFFGMNLAYLYGVPFTKISGIEKQYKKEAFLSLGTVADTKKDRLLSWFNERRGDIFFNANNSNLLLRVKPLAELANEKSNAGLTGKALFSILNKRPEYENINMRMRKLKQAYKSYGDIKIADTETGKIIYSTDISELGTNISKEAYFYKPAKSRDIYFTDISMCARHKVPTLIMAAGMPAPVESATEALPRKIPAVLIFEIDPTDVFRDILHTGDGLGKSGEALLVNRDIRIISALKHPLANGEKAKILKYRIKAMPAHLAAQGKEAALEANDYRGTPVLAVTRSIAISPDFSWGLVVKRDKAELLAPLAEDMNFLLFLSIGCSLMAFIVLGIMTRTLTYPIKKLSSAAEQVAAGDLTARTAIHSSDELGTLAATFDQMVQRLQSWNAELEAQITERTAQLGSSNAALRESELQYRTLFDSAGDLIAIHRFGKFIEINRVGCERLGYSHEELLNMGPAEISDPESAALLPERFDELREHGQITFETTHITRSGKKIPTEINTKLIEYAGKPAVLSIARDITERKRADETIRANEEKYRRLFDVEPDALQLVDAETLDILDVNEASCALFEYSKEEFLKLKITAISAEPDDTSARIKKGVSGATVRVPLRLCRKKNGEIFPVEMSLVFFEIDGKQRLFGALRDISERHRAEEALRQSEEKYRELVENANSIILRLDTSGNFTFINEFAQKFFGFPEEEILGRNVVGTIVPKVETGGRDLEAMVADVMAQPEEY
ncbi:MAG: PAS domain S-box protein, partial [bacterium]